jgi:hypothetical protein
MKKILSAFFLSLVAFHISLSPVFAIEDPLTTKNNKFGIHILFPTELPEAAKLVNSSGGDWGYVTIPIQSKDKDLDKWQAFMDSARKNHIIPIIRLATENDYFNTAVWRKPTEFDVLDFANFLHSLNWPTKNKYVIAFNEVNRGDEWGGEPDAASYAQILSYTVDAFKSKDPDFFILSSGMDNASANMNNARNEYDFLREMAQEDPDIFNKIDGIASHSYPNPGFSQPPTKSGPQSIATFKYERALAQSLSGKKLPVFITETGWSTDAVAEEAAALYFKYAFTNVWDDEGLIAVTPFLFRAGSPFEHFSFMHPSGELTQEYKIVESLPKEHGVPLLTAENPSAPPVAQFPFNKAIFGSSIKQAPPEKSFVIDTKNQKDRKMRRVIISTVLEWFLKF